MQRSSANNENDGRDILKKVHSQAVVSPYVSHDDVEAIDVGVLGSLQQLLRNSEELNES